MRNHASWYLKLDDASVFQPLCENPLPLGTFLLQQAYGLGIMRLIVRAQPFPISSLDWRAVIEAILEVLHFV